MRPEIKTIIIKTSGGLDIGLGHVYRSLSLARQLARDFRVVFHVNNNPLVKALLQEQASSFFVNEDITRLVTKEGTSLLLLDQLSNDEGIFRKLKLQHPDLKIVALDYFDYDNEFVDVVINLFNQNLEKTRPERDSVQYYEGLEYAIIREELLNYVPQQRRIPQKANRILVTFGGIDLRNRTGRALQLLDAARIRDTEVNVVLGPLWKGKLPAGDTFAPRIHQSVSASAMAKLMVEADLALCSPGTTMLELLSVGTPAVVLPQNPLEDRFALHVEQKGAIKVIREEARQDDINYVARFITSPQERERLSQRSRALVDGRGKERICQIITTCLERQ